MNKELWDKLSNFTKEILKNRDETHGYDHLKKVAENSQQIFVNTVPKNDEKYKYLEDLTITVAWFHDIVDHKYNDAEKKFQRIRVIFK